MADILQTFQNAFYLMKRLVFCSNFIKTLRQTGDKQLSDPVMNEIFVEMS